MKEQADSARVHGAADVPTLDVGLSHQSQRQRESLLQQRPESYISHESETHVVSPVRVGIHESKLQLEVPGRGQDLEPRAAWVKCGPSQGSTMPSSLESEDPQALGLSRACPEATRLPGGQNR